MKLQKLDDGQYLLTNFEGQVKFKNLVKYIKYQILCPHRYRFWEDDLDCFEEICERCGKSLLAISRGKI